jgi:hypothetical protein
MESVNKQFPGPSLPRGLKQASLLSWAGHLRCKDHLKESAREHWVPGEEWFLYYRAGREGPRLSMGLWHTHTPLEGLLTAARPRPPGLHQPQYPRSSLHLAQTLINTSPWHHFSSATFSFFLEALLSPHTATRSCVTSSRVLNPSGPLSP